MPTITELYAEFAEVFAKALAMPGPTPPALSNPGFDEAMSETSDIANEIVVAPAETVQEMLLKIRVALWGENALPLDQIDGEVWEGSETVEALSSLREDLRRLLAPTADERLLDLGRQFNEAWTEQKRVGDELTAMLRLHETDVDHEAHDRVSRLADEILATPAQSFAGLRVKARALLWCQSGEPCAQENPPRIPFDWRRPAEATDEKLIESILADLLRGQRNLDAPLPC
jgi:hypothetical protein